MATGLNAFTDGLRAATTGRALRAALWLHALTLAAAALLLVPLYLFASSTSSRSAVGDDLRGGLAADWIIDQVGTPGSSTILGIVAALALAAIPLHLALSVFASGGVVDAALRSLDEPPPHADTFLSASGRFALRFLGVAAVEALALAVVLVVVGLPGLLLDGALAWAHLAVLVLALAAVVSLSDFARIGLVAAGGAPAVAAAREGLRAARRGAAAWALVLLLDLALALAAAAAAAAVDAALPKERAAGLVLAVVLGQALVYARLWARVAAYAAETAVFLRFRRGE